MSVFSLNFNSHAYSIGTKCNGLLVCNIIIEYYFAFCVYDAWQAYGFDDYDAFQGMKLDLTDF